jgi:regulator of telomere elongation helicase 1
MIEDVGITIASYVPKVPGGILVFFSSYPKMNYAYDRWNKKGQLSLIEKHKKVFVEPNNQKDFLQIIKDYYEEILHSYNKGAVMLGVCRGRISEGIDFSDNLARLVIIVGIPYP